MKLEVLIGGCQRSIRERESVVGFDGQLKLWRGEGDFKGSICDSRSEVLSNIWSFGEYLEKLG